jgi:hypothetical protein
VGAYAACAAFIRDARDAGWDVPIANVSFVGSESLLGLLTSCGKERDRDYSTNLINSQVVPSYNSDKLPAVREYKELMDQYGPQVPAQFANESYAPLRYSFVSMEGFLDAKVLVEILKRMEPEMDPARLRSVVESIDSLDIGIDVPVSFGPRKHQGMDQIYYVTVEDGRFIPIQGWKRWSK